MILVTGGSGLLGAHLLYLLCSAGQKIRAIKRNTTDVSGVLQTFAYYDNKHLELFNSIEWVDASLDDITTLDAALEGVNQVYHCAGLVSFAASDRDKLMQVNAEGTANLVDVALKAGVEKFCHVSSIAALGRGGDQGVTTEQSGFEPSARNSWYARSKYAGECEVWKASLEGMKTIVVYPSVIIGPGDWSRSSATLIPLVYKGLKFYTKGINGYVDVRDVAAACMQLMDSSLENEGFLLSAEDISYQELFNLIADALGKPRPSIYANRMLTSIAWRSALLASLFTGKAPVMTRATARTAHGVYRYSSQKIKCMSDFQFRSPAEAIQHTAAIFLKECGDWNENKP